MLQVICIAAIAFASAHAPRQPTISGKHYAKLTSQSDPVDAPLDRIQAHVHQQCRADPICAHRFFLDELGVDPDLFPYLFRRFVAVTDAQSLLEEHYMESDAVKQAWLVTMRLASFCTENEYVDATDRSCVCRPGKVCHEGGNDGYDVVSLNVLCAVIVLGMIYYATLHLSEFRVIYKNVLVLRKQHFTTPCTTCSPGATGLVPGG